MQSRNPVFARSEGFSRTGTPTYPGGGGYTDPSTWQVGTPRAGQTGQGAPPTTGTERMTIDSVVMRTAMTLGLLVLSAAATWYFTGDPTTTDAAGNPTSAAADAQRTLMMAWMAGAFAGLGLGLFISFKRKVSPALVLAYAVVEGIFIGAMSKWFESMWQGIVPSAVLGTLAAFVATLAAYKFFNITVTPKFRKFVTIAAFGFVALVLFDFVLGFFGSAIGFNGFGKLGLLMSVIGLVLGIFMLILDFDYVEQGVRAGLPEVESWRAAFGLTVTLVWIYIEMLRILAILRGDE